MAADSDRNVIDFNKLENVQAHGDGTWDAACPACRAEGGDTKGNHLRIWPSMAFTCAKYRKDKVHNRQILAIAGTIGGEIQTQFAPVEPTIKVEEIYSDSMLDRLIRDPSYWMQRKPFGVSPETLFKFEGGIATTGKLKHRYVFPMRDEYDRIHGFSARYIYPIKEDYDTPRWKKLGPKEKFIFDRARVKKHVLETGIVTLVEGIGCTLALADIGYWGCIPTSGVVPSSALLGFLISLRPKKIVISLNNELDNVQATLTGNEASNRTLGILSNFFDEDMLLVRLPDNKDWLETPPDKRLIFKESIYGRI